MKTPLGWINYSGGTYSVEISSTPPSRNSGPAISGDRNLQDTSRNESSGGNQNTPSGSGE